MASGADYIIATDLSCLMHLDGYINKKELPLKTMHIADVLASGWE
jgi:L-lactate dehydrogenase complex protein LldE